MRYFKILLLLAAAAITFTACESKEEQPEQTENQTMNTAMAGGAHKIKVLEAMDAASYTYMRVEENGNEYWIAAPQMSAKEGQILYYNKGMEMQNFESKSLNRTFDKILFVDKVSASDNEGVMESPHARGLQLSKEEVKVDPVSGGMTIEEIYDRSKELEGKTVKVRGKVTKFNPDIMDKNWVHLQDGSGNQEAGNFDLMATTNDQTATGQVVILEGTLRLKKDFGAGYFYPVMLEDAKIVK